MEDKRDDTILSIRGMSKLFRSGGCIAKWNSNGTSGIESVP